MNAIVKAMILFLFLVLPAQSQPTADQDQEPTPAQKAAASLNVAAQFAHTPEERSKAVGAAIDGAIREYGKCAVYQGIFFIANPAIKDAKLEPTKGKVAKLNSECIGDTGDFKLLVCMKRSLLKGCTSCLEMKCLCANETPQDLCPEDSEHKLFTSIRKAREWYKLNCDCK
ncbi:MAG: hypothetical protein ACLQPD_17685 [Desulfomonilaceae bacterium]